jgi:cytochrome c5
MLEPSAMRILLPLILCISGSALIGCGDDGDDTSEGGDGDGDDCADAPTYESFGEDFVGTYCLGCHASAVPGKPDNNFDSLDDIADQADNMVDALMSGAMPPAGATKPSEEDRDKAIQWLSCGAE